MFAHSKSDDETVGSQNDGTTISLVQSTFSSVFICSPLSPPLPFARSARYICLEWSILLAFVPIFGAERGIRFQWYLRRCVVPYYQKLYQAKSVYDLAAKVRSAIIQSPSSQLFSHLALARLTAHTYTYSSADEHWTGKCSSHSFTLFHLTRLAASSTLLLLCTKENGAHRARTFLFGSVFPPILLESDLASHTRIHTWTQNTFRHAIFHIRCLIRWHRRAFAFMPFTVLVSRASEAEHKNHPIRLPATP